MVKKLKEVDKEGLVAKLHSIGDGAVRLVLDAIEAVMQRTGVWCASDRSQSVARLRGEAQHRWPKPYGFAPQQGPTSALRHSECSDLHTIKGTVWGLVRKPAALNSGCTIPGRLPMNRFDAISAAAAGVLRNRFRRRITASVVYDLSRRTA